MESARDHAQSVRCLERLAHMHNFLSQVVKMNAALKLRGLEVQSHSSRKNHQMFKTRHVLHDRYNLSTYG